MLGLLLEFRIDLNDQPYPPAQPAQEEPAPCLAEEETTSSEAPGLMGGIAGSLSPAATKGGDGRHLLTNFEF